MSVVIMAQSRISAINSKVMSSYTPLGFKPGYWTTKNDTEIPILVPLGAYPIVGLSIYSQERISDVESKQKNTYEILGYDFTTPVWYIQEGKGFPTLQETLPEYDALMYIATPSGLAAIALYAESDSPLAIRYGENTYKVGVVEVTAEDASVIKVMTPSGVKALQRIEIEGVS